MSLEEYNLDVSERKRRRINDRICLFPDASRQYDDFFHCRLHRQERKKAVRLYVERTKDFIS